MASDHNSMRASALAVSSPRNLPLGLQHSGSSYCCLLHICKAPLICSEDTGALSRSQFWPIRHSSRHQCGCWMLQESGQIAALQDKVCSHSAHNYLLLMAWREPSKLLPYLLNVVKCWGMETRNRTQHGKSLVQEPRGWLAVHNPPCP